jgi:hypothetical protein
VVGGGRSAAIGGGEDDGKRALRLVPTSLRVVGVNLKDESGRSLSES